jgi:small subunit ribosomal protein S16
MATRIRLRRLGAKKRPFYRVVVADQRAPRDGRFIENIGKYHPLDDPSLIQIDEDRALHWLRVGAQPSDQVRNLMVKTGIWDKFVIERPGAAALVKTRVDKPTKEKVSKKAAAKAAAKTEAPPAPVEAPSVPVEEAPAPVVEEVAVDVVEPTPDAEPVAIDETPAEEATTEDAAAEETIAEETPEA